MGLDFDLFSLKRGKKEKKKKDEAVKSSVPFQRSVPIKSLENEAPKRHRASCFPLVYS